MPKQVNSGVGGELPHQKRKSGVGSNILQQNGSVSKSDTRPDRNSEVGRSKSGSVSKSDTRPDRGNLALSIAGGDVDCYHGGAMLAPHGTSRQMSVMLAPRRVIHLTFHRWAIGPRVTISFSAG